MDGKKMAAKCDINHLARSCLSNMTCLSPLFSWRKIRFAFSLEETASFTFAGRAVPVDECCCRGCAVPALSGAAWCAAVPAMPLLLCTCCPALAPSLQGGDCVGGHGRRGKWGEVGKHACLSFNLVQKVKHRGRNFFWIQLYRPRPKVMVRLPH